MKRNMNFIGVLSNTVRSCSCSGLIPVAGIDQIMVANLKDKAQSWTLEPDGTYVRSELDDDGFSAHTYFMTNPSLSGRGKALEKFAPSPHLVLDNN